MTAIYNYHYYADTKAYSHKSLAQPNQRKEGQWLEKKNSTFTEPPAPKEGHAIIWKGDAWQLVPDNRGHYWHKENKSHMEITDPGVPVPEEYTSLNPNDPEAIWEEEPGVWGIPLSVVRHRACQHIEHYIKSERRKLEENYTSNERATWDIQIQGAGDILAGAESLSASIVNALALERKEEPEAFARKVIGKSEQYAQSLADLLIRERRWIEEIKETDVEGSIYYKLSEFCTS